MDAPLVIKICSIAALLVFTPIATLLPLVIAKISARCSKSVMPSVLVFLELAQAFAGGIILGVGLAHLLPESQEKIAEAFATIVASAAETATSNNTITSNSTATRSMLSLLNKQEAETKESHHWTEHFPFAHIMCGLMCIFLFILEHVVTHFVCVPSPASSKSKQVEEKQALSKLSCCTRDQWVRISIEGILWFSLTLHSVFSGIAFGAETHEKNVWQLFAAIFSHHFIEAFAFGAIMERSIGAISILPILIFTATYTIATPAGIGLGIGLTFLNSSPAFQIVQGMLMSLSAGAFLYIALFEILGSHNHHHAFTNTSVSSQRASSSMTQSQELKDAVIPSLPSSSSMDTIQHVQEGTATTTTAFVEPLHQVDHGHKHHDHDSQGKKKHLVVVLFKFILFVTAFIGISLFALLE